jgi:biopolymer transport protein ExbD
MKHRDRAVVEENVSPNLIPMIDIMFLLLLFFMLSADMTERRAEDLVLPRASSARPDDSAHADEIVNIHHRTAPGSSCAVHENGGVCRDENHWGWAVLGREYTDTALPAQLAELAGRHVETSVDPVARKRLSAAKVLVRADGSAPYGDVQKVIEACGLATIHEVEVAAALPTQR